MNNKGFTMIELLIIIGLLGIVSIMMAINMSGILGSEKEDEYENFKQAIESAACTYIDKQANVDLRNQFKNSGGGNVYEFCRFGRKTVFCQMVQNAVHHYGDFCHRFFDGK